MTHLFACNVSLDWHAIEIVVGVLYFLCRDACACVWFFFDYCEKAIEFQMSGIKRENPDAAYLVGTHWGVQHGLARSYASKLTLSPLLCLSFLCPMHGLHEWP